MRTVGLKIETQTKKDEKEKTSKDVKTQTKKDENNGEVQK